MKTITNKTENDILNVQILGNVYSIKAGQSLDVTAEVAEFWKNNIHQFLLIEDMKPITKEVEVSEVKEEVKEVLKKKK